MDTSVQNQQKKPKVFVKTMGCKVNSFDSDALASQFVRAGYPLENLQEQADIIVLNTCSVTEKATKEVRYLLRRYSRENPEAMKVVTGCYAQIDSALVADWQEVDYVVPNEVKEQLVSLVEDKILTKSEEKFPPQIKLVADNKQKHFKSAVTLFDSPMQTKTRVFLKIQDGCNGFCTYCQIPLARGASRSVPFDQVFTEVKKLADSGVQEVVLTGIHIGDYGEDFAEEGDLPFVRLLGKIFEDTKLPRLRISSLEPSEVSIPMLQVLKKHEQRFCDHFHLPLQSGCDPILKKMGRSYTCEEYAENVAHIRSYFPNAQISADVIPGFPGETEEFFQDTVAFIKKVNIVELHVFPYSKRPNTVALRLPDHLPIEVTRGRVKVLKELSKNQKKQFEQQFLGTTHQVLWEKTPKDERLQGKTKNYIRVVSVKGAQKAGCVESAELHGYVSSDQLLAVSTK